MPGGMGNGPCCDGGSVLRGRPGDGRTAAGRVSLLSFSFHIPKHYSNNGKDYVDDVVTMMVMVVMMMMMLHDGVGNAGNDDDASAADYA